MPVGPSVPAAVVRLALGVLGLVTLVVAFAGPGPGAQGLFAAALSRSSSRSCCGPRSGWPALVVLVAGVRVLLVRPARRSVPCWRWCVLVHLTLWTAALAARTTWRASIEWAVIGRGLRDVAVVQVFALALAVVAVALVGPAPSRATSGARSRLSARWRVTVLVLPRASASRDLRADPSPCRPAIRPRRRRSPGPRLRT